MSEEQWVANLLYVIGYRASGELDVHNVETTGSIDFLEDTNELIVYEIMRDDAGEIVFDKTISQFLFTMRLFPMPDGYALYNITHPDGTTSRIPLKLVGKPRA